MIPHDLAFGTLARLKTQAPPDQTLTYLLLAGAALMGFILGRVTYTENRVYRLFGHWRSPQFQNDGEVAVSRVLRARFGPPDYHLLNHVTLQQADGTTQIDHVLVSRFGVFVIETKDFNGWIFGDATQPKWTHVYFKQKFKRQNPILQNFRHVCAIREALPFLPPSAVTSVVVLSGDAEFKTPRPQGVVHLSELPEHVASCTTPLMSVERMEQCIGRIESIRLAISGETDVEHVQNLRRRFRGRGQ